MVKATCILNISSLLLFAPSTSGMKTTLSYQNVSRPENVNITRKGHSHCEGPQGRPRRDFDQLLESWVSLARERRGSGWGGRNLQSHSEPEQGCYPGLPVQNDIWECSLPHQCPHSGEWVLGWNLKWGGWKIQPQGSDEVQCCLFWFSSPEEWINHWRKWYCKPQQLKTRPSESFGVASVYLKREQCSRLMCKI